jgi:hypothetical protein
MTTATRCYECTAPTKTQPKGFGLSWDPAGDETGPVAGILTVDGKRCRCRYEVTEFAADFPDCRAWTLRKLDAGTDATESHYSCMLASNRQDKLCECRGFAATGSCCHLLALEALLENGWL